MAGPELMSFEPIRPNLDEIDVDLIQMSYDEDTDTLLMYLSGEPQPAVSVNVDANHFLLVDPETQVVVGFQIEGFMRTVVVSDPFLVEVAELAGVPAGIIEQARARITPQIRKQVVSRLFLDHFLQASA